MIPLQDLATPRNQRKRLAGGGGGGGHGGVKMYLEVYQELVGAHYLPLQEKSLAWFKEREINLLRWPPASTDLNPLDCSVWSWIEARVQRQKPTTVDQLRKLIVRAFDEFLIGRRRSCRWAVREEASGLRAEGGSWFQHTLWVQRRKELKMLWSEFRSQVFSLLSSSFLRFVGLFLILSVVEEWCETRIVRPLQFTIVLENL